jgi:PRTRC genetic system protein C
MASIELNRSFSFKGNDLPDPNRTYPVEKVISFYSNTYPELVSGTIGSTKINEQTNTIEYEIVASIGVKG